MNELANLWDATAGRPQAQFSIVFPYLKNLTYIWCPVRKKKSWHLWLKVPFIHVASWIALFVVTATSNALVVRCNSWLQMTFKSPWTRIRNPAGNNPVAVLGLPWHGCVHVALQIANPIAFATGILEIFHWYTSLSFFQRYFTHTHTFDKYLQPKNKIAALVVTWEEPIWIRDRKAFELLFPILQVW